MAHLDNKDKVYEQYDRSHEHLINKHVKQITELQLRVQNLAFRLYEVEQMLADTIHKLDEVIDE